jgi:mRNA interferase MazF
MADEYSIRLENDDFTFGGLNQSSRVRADRLFTADTGIIAYAAGRVTEAKWNEVVPGS